MIQDDKMKLSDWLCLDYVDKLKVLIDNPWGVAGIHYSAALLAQYLIDFRPAHLCENPETKDGETSIDIMETLECTYHYDIRSVAEFMLLLGYKLDCNEYNPCWNMKHIESI